MMATSSTNGTKTGANPHAKLWRRNAPMTGNERPSGVPQKPPRTVGHTNTHHPMSHCDTHWDRHYDSTRSPNRSPAVCPLYPTRPVSTYSSPYKPSLLVFG